MFSGTLIGEMPTPQIQEQTTAKEAQEPILAFTRKRGGLCPST